MNKAAETMLSYLNQDVLGKSFVNIVHAESLEGEEVPPSDRTFTKAVLTRAPIRAQIIYIRKDGKKFIAEVVISPIYIDDVYDGAVQVFKDISKEKEIDKAKTEFVSIASHRLRTPLGITKWSLESIKDDAYLKTAPEAIHTTLDDIYKSNEQVLTLVRNLLSVSRIDQGRVKDKPVSTDVQELLQDLVKEMNVLAVQKNIKLSLAVNVTHTAETFPHDVRGDFIYQKRKVGDATVLFRYTTIKLESIKTIH